MIFTGIASVIAWVVQNPGIIKSGEQAVVDAVQTVIGIFNRHKAGDLTADQLQAEWVAAGIPLKVIEDAATAAGL